MADGARKLLGKTALFAGGNLLYMLGQFVFLTLLARLSDPFVVGVYGLANALLNPLFFMTKMGMRQAQAADASDSFAFATYKTLRTRFLVVAVLISLAMIPFLPPGPAVVLIFTALVGAKLAEASADLYYGLMLQRGAQGIAGVSMTLRAIACVACFLGIYAATKRADWAVLGMPLGWFAVFFLHDLPRSRPLLPGTDVAPRVGETPMSLLKVLWPLAIGGAIGQIQQSFPRVLVNHAFDTETLGAIVPGLQVHVMAVMLGMSVCQSLLPSVARQLQNGNPNAAVRQVKRILMLIVPLLVVGVLICQFWGGWLIALVFGKGFELSGEFLGVLALSWSFRIAANVIQNLVFGTGRYHSVLAISSVVTAVLVAASLILWPLIGFAGILWGLAIGSGAHLAMATWQARQSLTKARQSIVD